MTAFNIIDACRDSKVFRPAFRHMDTWRAWFAFLAALFGLPMDEDQHRIFTECTQRTDRPTTPASEAWLVCGRRAGKSFTLALIAVFLACSRDWLPYLGIGERGTVMVIAADRRQARTILRYVKGLLQLVPMLTRMIEAERQEAVDLNNRISIEVHTASFKTVRGYTIVAALLDEIAFWPTDPDSADPDGEVVSAIKPAMATIPNAMFCGDRYAGEWPREQFRKHCIQYEPSADSKGAIYGNLLPLLNSAKVRLLNNKRLISQLIGLERRTARGGRDSIDHAPGGHDDCANAVAGALLLAVARKPSLVIGCQDGSSLHPNDDGSWTRRWGDERQRLNVRTVTVRECDMETHGLSTAPTPMFKPFKRAVH